MRDNVFSLDVIDHVQIMSTLKERQNLVKYCVRRACDLRLLNTTALFQSIIIQREGDSVVTVSCRLALGWKGGGGSKIRADFGMKGGYLIFIRKIAQIPALTSCVGA